MFRRERWWHLVLVLLVAAVAPVSAQEGDGLRLTLSRDFGYGSLSGLEIQGTFSMRVEAPADVVRVVFYMDDEPAGEDSQPPFRLQFKTDNYGFGRHTMRAAGFTADDRELRSNEAQREFVPASEGWEAAGGIAAVVLGAVIVAVAISLLIARAGGRSGTGYGLMGGAICPKCLKPFAVHVWSLNAVGGRFDRCPHCRKWSLVRRATPHELAAAEEALAAPSPPADDLVEMSDADKLRRALDESRFDNT